MIQVTLNLIRQEGYYAASSQRDRAPRRGQLGGDSVPLWNAQRAACLCALLLQVSPTLQSEQLRSLVLFAAGGLELSEGIGEALYPEHDMPERNPDRTCHRRMLIKGAVPPHSRRLRSANASAAWRAEGLDITYTANYNCRMARVRGLGCVSRARFRWQAICAA
jgi:hypothetical protein